MSYRALIVSIRQESTHVKYCIEMTQLEKHEQWQIYRRYRDFLQLHHILRSSAAPALPGRRAYGLGRWIYGEDAAFIAERQKELEKYLQALIDMDPSLSHGALRLFLGLPALPSNMSLEASLAVQLPEISWKTPSKVDLRLLRRLISPEMRLRLADVPLSPVELPSISRHVSEALGFVGARHFRAACRAVAQTVQRSLESIRSESSNVYLLSAWMGRPAVLSLFSPKSCSFQEVPLPRLDPYYAVASRGGNLYILTSGEDASLAGMGWRSSFHCWQPLKQHWRRLPGRPVELTRFALTAAGSAIYAVGGVGLRGYSPSVHRFEGAWEALPELHEARGDVAAAVKGSVLYALGGTNQRGEATTAVESLDLWTRAWRSGPPLLSPRHAGAATSTAESLLLFGGSAVARGHLLADAVSPPAAECLSHRWAFWAPLPAPPQLQRHGCAAVTLAGKVYVFGGYDADMAQIDRWDSETCHWDSLELPEPLQGVCVATVAVS